MLIEQLLLPLQSLLLFKSGASVYLRPGGTLAVVSELADMTLYLTSCVSGGQPMLALVQQVLLLLLLE